jgi:hypothetical protein
MLKEESTMKSAWPYRKIFLPIVDLLRQGITPEKIALRIALGAVLGIFPVLGSTTLLCAAAAFILRLNMPAIQVVNFLIYPPQLILFLSFLQAGSRITGAARVTLSKKSRRPGRPQLRRDLQTLIWQISDREYEGVNAGYRRRDRGICRSRPGVRGAACAAAA